MSATFLSVLLLLLLVSFSQQSYVKYHEYYIFDKPLTFLAAFEKCATLGLNLTMASPRSKESLQELLLVCKNNGLNGTWIGFTDLMDNGSWYWLDNGELCQFSVPSKLPPLLPVISSYRRFPFLTNEGDLQLMQPLDTNQFVCQERK